MAAGISDTPVSRETQYLREDGEFTLRPSRAGCDPFFQFDAITDLFMKGCPGAANEANMSHCPGHHTPSWMSLVCLNKLDYAGATETAQQRKLTATKPDDWSLILGPTRWQQRTHLQTVPTSTHGLWHVDTKAHAKSK